MNASSLGSRRWNAEKLVGPLQETEDPKSVGYKHHLLSVVKYTKTVIEIKNDTITYKIIDLDTNEIVQQFGQELIDSSFYGPIVTPYQQGANISWKTARKDKTMLCVNNVLYYGSNRSLDTK